MNLPRLDNVSVAVWRSLDFNTRGEDEGGRAGPRSADEAARLRGKKRDVTKGAAVLPVPAGELCRGVPVGGANDVI